MADLVPRACRALEERLAEWDQGVNQERQDLEERREPMEKMERLDHRACKVCLDPWVSLETRDPLEKPVRRAGQVWQELLAQEAIPARTVWMDLRDRLDHLDLQETEEHQDHPVREDSRACLEPLARWARLERTESVV